MNDEGSLRDSNLENRFAQLVNKARWEALWGTSKIKFRLDTLTNYSWDSVIIMTPYYSIDDIERSTKINLSEIRQTGIEMNDGINVLAFLRDGKLISYIDLSRRNGDFSYSIDSSRIFIKENALFEVTKSNKMTLYGPLFEIKPIK